jgi:riboflavin kinase/FMN adenylyltransferase
MEVVKGYPKYHPSDRGKFAVVTIGNFDGVHLGHQKIIAITKEKAKTGGGESVAYTFRPHPRAVIHPDAPPALLLTYDEKLQVLASQGIDVTIEEPFSREFSTTSPDTFFRDILIGHLKARAVVVGYDFAFGRQREGSLRLLETFCQQSGVELTIVPPLKVGDETVSSTAIREHLMRGEIERANEMMGRQFSYRGVVIKGEGRGRTIGFPTANLKLDSKLALPYGVYATWANLNGKIFPSVTNVGVRPTFQVGSQELPALIETHLLDETIDLYGHTLEVRFVQKLRNEIRFSGPDKISALIAQITLDAEAARKRLVS